MHERLRQLDALLHAGRVGLDIAVAGLAEADVVEHLVRALHRVGRRQARQLAAIGDERHRIHAGDVGVALRHVADAGANLERRRRDVQAQDRHLALSGFTKPSSVLMSVLLPAPFGPEQADRARVEVGRHVLQRPVLAVADADAARSGQRDLMGRPLRAANIVEGRTEAPPVGSGML